MNYRAVHVHKKRKPARMSGFEGRKSFAAGNIGTDAYLTAVQAMPSPIQPREISVRYSSRSVVKW